MQQPNKEPKPNQDEVDQALDRAFQAVDREGFTPHTADVMREALAICERNGIVLPKF